MKISIQFYSRVLNHAPELAAESVQESPTVGFPADVNVWIEATLRGMSVR